MENKEIRILLTEGTFTHMCKQGFITYFTSPTSRIEFPISSMDMRLITKGEILSKEVEGHLFNIALQDIGTEMIREILKRSPVFSGMAYEI